MHSELLEVPWSIFTDADEAISYIVQPYRYIFQSVLRIRVSGGMLYRYIVAKCNASFSAPVV